MYPAETAEEARPILHRLAREDTAILYLTEQLAAGLEAEIARYKDALTPAIILIPASRLSGHRHGQCEEVGGAGGGRRYPISV